MIKDFQILSKLGEGAYSIVYKVKRLTDGKEYALKRVKLLNLNDKEKENALNEIRILASIRNPNVIGYKEAFWENKSNSLCIIMEYANDGDLYQKITYHKKKGIYVDEKEIWNVLIQMIRGLKALHELNIYHRDLKSANVFICKDKTVKIGDMNVSKVAKKGLLYTQTGTPYYASPEVWKDKPYDSKSDIWSCGCVIYELATLKPPFRAQDLEGLYHKVIKGAYNKLPSHYSVDLNNIIKIMLQVNPEKRPSCDELLESTLIRNRMDTPAYIEEEIEESNKNLLNTIRCPMNIHYLTDKLPKPNYEQPNSRVSYDTGFQKPLGRSEEKHRAEAREAPGPKELSRQLNSSVLDSGEREELPMLKKANKPLPVDRDNLEHNELLARRQQKIESQLKKYDKIINMSKQPKVDLNPSAIKQKIELLIGEGNKGGGNNIKKDFMKIYGVKLSQPIGSIPTKNHNRSKLVSKSSNPNLPKIDKISSNIKLAKYEKLPKVLAL
jgi:NIMA (never in mitosis gene a)-related kinase